MFLLFARVPVASNRNVCSWERSQIAKSCCFPSCTKVFGLNHGAKKLRIHSFCGHCEKISTEKSHSLSHTTDQVHLNASRCKHYE